MNGRCAVCGIVNCGDASHVDLRVLLVDQVIRATLAEKRLALAHEEQDRLQTYGSKLEDELLAARADQRRAREDVRKYGRHLPDCFAGGLYRPEGCICGYREACRG